MSRLESLLRFIWDFVMGDDWRIAAGVTLALAATSPHLCEVDHGQSVHAWPAAWER
jgi:hypothetical protein